MKGKPIIIKKNKSKARLSELKYVLIFSFCLFFLDGISQVGTAPVNSPFGGFRIDGYMQRQGSAGDWLPGTTTNAPGTYVIDNSNLPIMPIQFFQLFDRWNDKDDDVFLSGRFNDDPNTMQWQSKKSPPKNDINRSFIFFKKDAQKHFWMVFAGDRFKKGGDSYIDIEFFQNAVTQTGGPIPGGIGGFASTGPNNGRTIGDITISMNFENPVNSISPLKVYQWIPTNSDYTSFDYVPITFPLPDGSFFAASNATTINVPGGAFGSTIYPSNTFAEFAIDLSAVVGGPGGEDECGQSFLPFKTMWIKSRSSASITSSLVDFIKPIQLNLIISNTNIFTTISYFDLQTGQFTATVTPGINDDYEFNWSAVGIIENDTLNTNIKGTLNDYHISNSIFTNHPGYVCYQYVWDLTVKGRFDSCFIGGREGGGLIILSSPCDRIGKPINPDKAFLDRNIIIEREVSTDNEIKIYPNPSSGSATIVLPPKIGIKNIALISMMGVVIQRWNNTAASPIDFKNLPQGVYLLKVVLNSGEIRTKRIVINKN